MNMQKTLSLLFILFFIHPVFGASSENYAISSDVLGAGGEYGVSENYAIEDTLGEAIIGRKTSETYSDWQGFWTPDSVTLSISCDASVDMGAIIGTGQSNLTTNSALCTVITDNPSGYQLSWESDADDLTNGVDVISAYTPAVLGTPEVWSVASVASEWGGSSWIVEYDGGYGCMGKR